MFQLDARYEKTICKMGSNKLTRYVDSSSNKGFLQHQCIMTWGKGGGCIIHCTTYVAAKDKTVFFNEQGNNTYRYMLEPILLFAF